MRKRRNEEKGTRAILIPHFIFQDRTLSVLEVIAEYLKEKRNMSFHEIAVALKRDDRTIWTVYSRAKKKREKQEKYLNKKMKEEK